MFSILKNLVRKPSPAAWMVRRDGRKSGGRARPLVERDISVGTSNVVHVLLSDNTQRTQHTSDPLPVPNATFHGGTISSRDLAWQAEVADEVRRRCVPWCNVAVGPYLEARARLRGDAQVHLCGLACPGEQDWILMSAQTTKSDFLSWLHHEVFHVAENWIDPIVINAVDSSLSPYGQQYGGNVYMRDPAERRARCYQHFAVLADEGLQVLVDVNRRDALGVFSSVYTGAFAQMLKEDGLI